MVKYILVSCICSVPALQQTQHNFLRSKSNRFKFVLEVQRSYTYRFVLFAHFYAIRYGDTVEQSFPARFAPMILANLWGGGGYIIGANRAGKRARSFILSVSRFVSYTRVAFKKMIFMIRYKSNCNMRVTAVTLDNNAVAFSGILVGIDQLNLGQLSQLLAVIDLALTCI